MTVTPAARLSMLSSRFIALSSPAKARIATIASEACSGVAAKPVSVMTKNAATASDVTILAIADIGAQSSYHPTAKSAAADTRTGAVSIDTPPATAAPASHPANTPKPP
jgi:hypothetical protein